VESRISEGDEPGSPLALQHEVSPILITPVEPLPASQQAIKVDVACPRPGDDMTVSDDGPVFRATIKALEQKTGNMRTQMKRVLKRAEQAHNAQVEANDAFIAFMESLREASNTNANAVQPAIDHYFDKIAREILGYEKQNALNLQKIIIEPISKLYTYDIKQAESKRRDFEEESKDYYAYVSRYLGQRQDSVKTKKLADSDTKYQTKRRNFELKRFDYSSFVQDLHGGRKEQEVLSHLTKYADSQAQTFLSAAKKIEELLPQLQALSSQVQEADKEFQYQRREREEKRRVLEKSNLQYNEPETVASTPGVGSVLAAGSNGYQASSDSELGRADSTGSTLKAIPTGNSGTAVSPGAELSRSPGSLGHAIVGSPSQHAKFKGIRDLEERDMSQITGTERSSTHRKEGLLWALNRPGSHVDPRALTKQQGWHK
jgi:Arf-GAP with SH3 domain, ANK repeat and PH domain-containing protein